MHISGWNTVSDVLHLHPDSFQVTHNITAQFIVVSSDNTSFFFIPAANIQPHITPNLKLSLGELTRDEKRDMT